MVLIVLKLFIFGLVTVNKNVIGPSWDYFVFDFVVVIVDIVIVFVIVVVVPACCY